MPRGGISAWPIVAGLAAIPFIQLGSSYWLSVQVGAAVLILVLLARSDTSLFLRSLAIYAGVLGCASLSLLVSQHADIEDALRICREILIYSFLVVLVGGVDRYTLNVADPAILRAVAIVVVISILALCILQVALIPARQFPTFPYDWFIANGGMLPKEIDLLYSDIRPAGPFGEPSYLAFIFVSLLMLLRPRFLGNKDIVVLASIVVGILLSRSASGYVGIAALGYLSVRGRLRTTLLCVAGAATVVLILFQGASNLSVLGRLSAPMADGSIFSRIFAPAAIIVDYLFQFPFGSPFRELPSNLQPFAEGVGVSPGELLHNGAANIVFSYGWLGPFMLLGLLWAAKDAATRVFLILAMVFNGAFLAPDKFVVIAVTLLGAELFRAHEEIVESGKSNGMTIDLALQQARRPPFYAY